MERRATLIRRTLRRWGLALAVGAFLVGLVVNLATLVGAGTAIPWLAWLVDWPWVALLSLGPLLLIVYAGRRGVRKPKYLTEGLLLVAVALFAYWMAITWAGLGAFGSLRVRGNQSAECMLFNFLAIMLAL